MCILCGSYVNLFECISILMRGSLNLVSRLSIDGMCVVDLAPAASTMSWATCHPLVMMLLMSGW